MEAPSFERDIRPLFRSVDQESMEWAFDLWKYQDVRDNAELIMGRLDMRSMPCDIDWTEERLALFRRWMEAGMPA